MPNYTTQYNPYLDLAGAAQGPAAGLMRVLTELPQQRAQARLLGSQVDENMARIGLMGEQGRTEQAHQSMLRSQGQEYTAHAGLFDTEAEQNRLRMELANALKQVVGVGSNDLMSQNPNTPAARAVLSLNAAANALNKNPNAMQQIVQGVNLMGAKGDPIALSNVQNAGRGVPFGRAVASGVTTPTILPEGASLASGMSGTNAPTISLTAPKVFNPGSTSSVDAARISARARLTAETLRQLGDNFAPSEEIRAVLQKALQDLDAPVTNAPPVGLPAWTNAPPVGRPAWTNAPVVLRYNPTTGKIE